MISRRVVLGAGAGSLLLGGCDRINALPAVRGALAFGEDASFGVQRLVTDRAALAREFPLSERSPYFRPNGTLRPASDDYARHVDTGFVDWRLRIDGLVARPLSLSMYQLRAGPARHQVTRHDCVEGWSAIGQWTGVPLRLLLAQAGVRRDARFAVFHCADDIRGVPYYESVDMVDALHPQTMLAWGLNGRPLPIENGAPLRLRVERQLGYKHAKYVHRVELVNALGGVAGGKGGFWEDVADYQWYAGI